MAAKVRKKHPTNTAENSFVCGFGKLYHFVTIHFCTHSKTARNRLKCRLVADQKKVKPDEFL
jgi:hypothetical protein